MMKSRIAAIREAKRISDRGGNRRWFTSDQKLSELGMKSYAAKEGHNFIAIIPPKDPTKYFGHLVHVHYNVGPNKNAFVCPTADRNARCPICEKRAQLEEEDAEVHKDLIYELRPSLRVLFFVVDMKDKSTAAEGVQLYDAPNTVNQLVCGASTNPRTGEVIDISDPQEGKIMVFERVGKGRNTKYQNGKIEDRPPLLPEWLEGLPEFVDILDLASYEEIQASFDGGVNEPPSPQVSSTTTSPQAEFDPAAYRKNTQSTQEQDVPVEQDSFDIPFEQTPPAKPQEEQVAQPEAQPQQPSAPPADAQQPQESSSISDIRKRIQERMAARKG